MRRTTIITALICAGLTSGLVFGGTPNPKDAERYKADADKSQKQSETFKTAADQATGDLKVANQTAADACHALSEVQQKFSAAAAAGDDMRALGTQYQAANDAVNRASELVSLRKTEAILSSRLTDAEQANLLKQTVDANKPLATDLINARKKSLETTGKLAVLLSTPGTTNEDLDNAREANQQASDAIDLAQTTLQINNDNVSFLARAGASDPSVAAAMTELSKIEQDYLAAFKNSRDQASLARQLQRKMIAQRNDIVRSLPKPAAPARPETPRTAPKVDDKAGKPATR